MKSSKVIRDMLLDALTEFAKLEDNWDSYGAIPITNGALEKAKYFLSGLFVCPTSGGGISISLGDEEIFIEIDGDGSYVAGKFPPEAEDVDWITK